MRIKIPWIAMSVLAFAIASDGLTSFAAPVLVSDGSQNYLVADNGIVAAGGTAVTTDPVDTNTDHYAEPGQFGGQDVDQPDSWNGDRRWGNDGANTQATWNFTGLDSGTYNVYASWRNGPQANVSTAHFSTSDSGPTADIDLSTGATAVSALTLNDGLQDVDFALIGSVTISDGDLTVSVDDSITGLDANTFIFSDAVAIGPIPIPEPNGMALLLLGLPAFAKRRKRSTSAAHP